MKYMLLTVEPEDGSTRSCVLEGDRRQSNNRMIELGLEKITDESLDTIEAGETYKTRDSKKNYEVIESRLINKEEVQELKQDHITFVINENVTENACQVRYSGSSRR